MRPRYVPAAREPASLDWVRLLVALVLVTAAVLGFYLLLGLAASGEHPGR